LDFVPGMNGTLIGLAEDENARFRFEIWFDYTRQNINLVREGAMLAVSNFASDAQEQRLSILEIVTIQPMHYGLGTDTSGYPGFVVEAAKSAASDWESQEHEATEDTTKIKCIAIPTNLEVVQSVRPRAASPELQEESNIPMLGHSARLLDSEFTQFVINYGIRADENTCPAGVLIRDENVSVMTRIQDLLRTHFGIFGFTGAGKSNLVSTLVDSVLRNSREPVKIVLFDLMSEYSTLLIDHLEQVPDALLIALGDETLPESVVERLSLPADATPQQQREALGRAVRDLVTTALVPPALSDIRRLFGYPMGSLLTQNKIRIWRERIVTIDEYLRNVRTEVIKGNLGNSRRAVNAFLDQLERDFGGQNFTQQSIEAITARIVAVQAQNLNTTASNCLQELRTRVQEDGARYANQRPLPGQLALTLPELVRRLNDSNSSGLYIVQAHQPDLLRHFAWMLGNFTYEERRRSGHISPLVSFVFDEADEFIPQQAKESYRESADIAMTLARRGRKFGLGLGIATQRVIYLDTSIMAQPHTYFVSKMPRQSDRQRVSEAFGASEDIFRQTFKFRKGDWLLMSHDATGLDAIPIPIHTEDANVRIRRVLNEAQARATERARN
jgi:uncharacterized protein